MISIFMHLKRISLTVKMILLTLVVGLISWVILDNIQSRKIENIFNLHLTEQLNIEAQEARLRFDNYVTAYNQTVKLVVSQKSFNDYITGGNRLKGDKVKYFSEIPPWLPDASVLRKFVHLPYALLLDDKGAAREVYQGSPEPLPPSLIKPSDLLRQMSHNQTLMTEIDGMPFVVTAESVINPQGRTAATLIFAAPLDDDFLISSQGLSAGRGIVALVSSNEHRILASNKPDILPDGAALKDIEADYLMTGKSFFDTGSSDLLVHFSSFLSRKEYEDISRAILAADRRQRAIAAAILIISVSALIYWITNRITILSGSMVEFSEKNLGTESHELLKGDQLYILEERFKKFTVEIISAQEKLRKDAEEMLNLTKKNLELEMKALRGMLPICAWCKKIRDDKGYWSQVELYVEKHSDATFTHGICPECLKKISPETIEKIEKTGTK